VVTEEPIRVLIVEDHTIVRQGLISLLETFSEIEIAGQCGTGLDGLRLARELSPDVIILDLSLPDMGGIEVIHSLKEDCPTARVVVLSMHSGPEYVKPALHAGAKGYLVKGADVRDLVKAIQAALQDEVFLSPGVAKVLLDSDASPLTERLSPREQEILRYVAQGKTSREVGIILSISTKTVENHRQNIMRKLEVHDVVSLTRLAIRSGLVSPE